TQETWTRVAVTDGSTSVNHSPVVLTDTFGTAMEYQWRVRAIAEASTRPGPFSDVVTLTMTQDTEPPNTPSLPTVTTDLRIITVDIDGLDEFGEAMPVDYNHTRIYFAAAEDMVGAERVGSLTQPGSWNSGSMTPDVPVWVAVSAVDHVGNESAMTPPQSVTPQKLVNDDSIRDELTGIDDKINTAVDDLNQAIDNIVVDANGTTTYWMPTEPDETTDPKPKTGDLWFDTSTAGKNKLHRFDGVSWVSAADERIDTIDQAQSDLEADVDRVRTSVDGKNAITQSTSTPPNQYDGAVGDIWEIMSSMGSGGRSVSRWRWNGTVWVSNLIGDTVLGNVDAAKVGTGHLSADRIESGTISTDKIAVGLAGNLLPDPLFLDPAISETRQNSGTRWSWKTVDGETCFESVMPDPASQADFRLSDAAGNPRYIPVAPNIKIAVELDASGPVSTYLQVRYSDGQDATPGSSLMYDLAEGRRIVRFVYDLTATTSSSGLPVATFSVSVRQTAGSVTPGTVTRVFSGRVSPMSGSTVIEDGAITTDKIAVGAITAESGIIADLNAGVIKSGTIDAARIGANTITADKLMVGRLDDLAPSPAAHRSEWSIENGAWVYQTALSYDGRGIQLTGSENASARGPLRATQPGETWYLSADSARSGTTASLAIRLFFYDSGKASTGSALAGSGIGSVAGAVEVPDGTAYVRFNIAPAGTLGSGLINAWNMHGRPQAGSTLIEDGAITTDKILANAITAGKIAALAIEADHIAANAITADKIHAGAIDGKLITGARIRTAASGRRTELDSEGLTSYNSAGKVVLTTSTSDGSIDMTGDLSQT
ncbi:MAG: hypothetical protein L0K67_12205, partial [Brevibacterium sp.]|nr:hypothetical protein [Brevibacterium sp.]